MLPQWKRNLMFKRSVAINRDGQPGGAQPGQPPGIASPSGINAGAGGLVGASRGGINSGAALVDRKRRAQLRQRSRIVGPQNIGTGIAAGIGNGQARGVGNGTARGAGL